MRQSIGPEERLLVTLRYLATGRSMEDFKFSECASYIVNFIFDGINSCFVIYCFK
nr:unnamed protein product [Callosobruchus analis]